MSNTARVWKHASGWCSLHRLWLGSASGCSIASLGWWWRWSRCLQMTGWRGRSTWGCGGGSLSWQPGWWAGFQTQWSGTWRGKVQIWGIAVLFPLKAPEEEVLKFLYCSLVPCGGSDYWEKENTKNNFHLDRHNLHNWTTLISILLARNWC